MQTQPENAQGDAVVTDSAGGVRTVTINRPGRLNAVDEATLQAIGDAVLIENDDRVIVLRGAGRGFCSGADLGAANDLADVAAAGTIDAANRAVGAMATSPLPIVAAVHGPCAGVGVSLALGADLVVASDAAFFQLAFSRIGLMPDGGATALVAASIGRARAMKMALLAERISAADAAAWGLIAESVADEAFEERVAQIVRSLAAGPSVAIAETKRAIAAVTLADLEDAFARERHGQIGLLAAADFREGVGAFAEKRAARFTDRP